MVESKPTQGRWREWAWLMGVLLLAGGMRFCGLTRQSLWYDEAYSVWTSQMDIASLRTLWRWQIEFPLYYLLLHYWMKLFGTGEFAVRAFGALAGTLTVLPFYFWGKALFDSRVGLLGAFLLAMNPYHLWYSQEVRMYAWALLFAVASLWAFWRLVRGAGWGWWVGYVLLTGLTFHLHYYIAWLVLVENLYYLWMLVKGAANSFWRGLKPWIWAQLGVLLLALPAFAVFMTKVRVFNQWGWLAERYGSPGLGELVQLFFFFTTGQVFPGPGVLRWLTAGIFGALVVWGAVAVWQKRPAWLKGEVFALLLLVLPLGALFIVGQFFTVWVPRYLLLLLPAFLLLVAVGVGLLPGRWRLGAVILLLGGYSLGLLGMYTQPQKEDWRGVAAYLETHRAPGELLLLMDAECCVPLEYYYKDRGPRVEVSRFADASALDDAVQEALQKRQGEKLWVVASHTNEQGLVQRLDALPHLRRVQKIDFVGVRLYIYEWAS
ncbi:MAG: glycosyltransferase family 39 protein [Anaerolineae bacterium]|nr:glycosyltransferase family 39 protein [Anaerolineae bacterium]